MAGTNAAYDEDFRTEITYNNIYIRNALNGSFTPSTSPVYRFFNTIDGTHFFTGDPSEATQLIVTSSNLIYEHSNFRSFDAPSSVGIAILSDASPVYRFFDQRFGTHFYTVSASEKNQVQATRSDLTFEGVSFYEHVTPHAGDIPVYRFFDTTYGTHLYTADASERASIVASRPDLKVEGIAFYSPTS